MNNKRTITIELTGGDRPQVMMHKGEQCDDPRINNLAKHIYVEVGKTVTDILSPAIQGMGFGNSSEEAQVNADLSIATGGEPQGPGASIQGKGSC